MNNLSSVYGDNRPVTRPRVAIIILNWNGCADTLECLASISAIDYPNFVAVVVDNGSTDGTPQEVRIRFPDAHLIETGRNLGYAGGNNVGIKWALDKSVDYILLLNNDTIVDPGILAFLVTAAISVDNAGIFGAKIFFYDRPELLCYGGARWDSDMGCPITLGWGEPDTGEYSHMVETAYVNGCALFAPTNVFRKAGLLDEGMFLIYEETDFCYRARKLGFKSWFVPEAKLWHKISAAIGGSESPLARYFNARNQLTWGNRHLPWVDRISLYRHVLRRLYRAYIPPIILAKTDASFLKRLAWALATWIKNASRNVASPGNKAELLGLLDYYRGHFGDCPEKVRAWNSHAKHKKSHV